MATKTERYGLVKPGLDEPYEIGVVNENADKIDAALHGLAESAADLQEAVASAGSAFGVIIRTQAEFEALIASPDWLGAASVCFVGDGGDLKFTRSDGHGIVIPQTVKQILGIDGAVIEVTNFAAPYTEAALWYAVQPEENDYWIKGLSVRCSSKVASIYSARAFQNCRNLEFCYGYAKGCSYDLGIGFRNCANLISCTAYACSSEPYATGTGFLECTNLVNCVGTAQGGTAGPSGGSASAFESCRFLVNCTGRATSISSGGTAFLKCSQLVNCAGSGISSSYMGYSFHSCSYLNGCTQLYPGPTTALLGGSNTHVDDATVAAS